MKSSHSQTVRAVLDFHYSHSTFSFPVLLKTNIAEFQEAHTRKVLPLFLHLHSQAVSFGPYWQPLIKVDGPLVRPEPVSISVISFKSVLRISLLCTTSETILDPALYSSYFYFQFGKNKPESIRLRGVCTTGAQEVSPLSRKLVPKSLHHGQESLQKHTLCCDPSTFIIQTLRSLERAESLWVESARKVDQIEKEEALQHFRNSFFVVKKLLKM